MLDDFFIRALIAGVGVAILAAPLGCFIVWRRLAYFGDTLAHAALLGVALGLLLNINISLSVFVLPLLLAATLWVLEKRTFVSSDALLGLMSHSTLALGLVLLSFITTTRVDLNALLFGDILAVSKQDILQIYGGGAVALVVLAFIWRPLFATTVNMEIAKAEGQNPERMRICFLFLLAFVIAIAMKIVGVLLITALLIIPATTSRQFASSPIQMACIGSIFGVLAVVAGLYSSLNFDTPTGPSIVVASLVLFLLCHGPLAFLYAIIKNPKRT